MGLCRVQITHKNKQRPCRFFAVTALLTMPDIETLELLSVNCNTRVKLEEQAAQWASKDLENNIANSVSVSQSCMT